MIPTAPRPAPRPPYATPTSSPAHPVPRPPRAPPTLLCSLLCSQPCAPQNRPAELTRTFAGGLVSQREQRVEVVNPSSGAVPLQGKGPVSGRGAWKQDFSLKAENARGATREACLGTAGSCREQRESGVGPRGPQAHP